jgi:hypothetical protein
MSANARLNGRFTAQRPAAAVAGRCDREAAIDHAMHHAHAPLPAWCSEWWAVVMGVVLNAMEAS